MDGETKDLARKYATSLLGSKHDISIPDGPGELCIPGRRLGLHDILFVLLEPALVWIPEYHITISLILGTCNIITMKSHTENSDLSAASS